MRLFAPLFVSLGLFVATLAHPGHSDVLGRHQVRALERRRNGLVKCSAALQARHEPRIARMHAKRDDLLASQEKRDGGEPRPPHGPPKNPQSSFAHTHSSVVRVVSASSASSTSTSTSSAGTSTTLVSSSLSGGPNGTFSGSLGGGGPGGGLGGGTTETLTATATAGTSIISTFPSTTSGAVPASETTQVSDGACILSPQQEEGPYYIAGEELRQNLIEDEEGIPFYMEFTLFDTNTCGPLANAMIEVWSCNATGEYGGFLSTDTDNYNTSEYNGLTEHLGDKNDGGSTIRDTKTALRGQQLTDDEGVAQFTTLVPGWYSGRAAHIHMRIHVGGSVTANGTYVGGNITHTGQTFFGEDLYSQVPYVYPYNLDTTIRTTNDEDRPWSQQNGSYAAWNLYYVNESDITQGLLGFVNLAVDSTATDQDGV